MGNRIEYLIKTEDQGIFIKNANLHIINEVKKTRQHQTARWVNEEKHRNNVSLMRLSTRLHNCCTYIHTYRMMSSKEEFSCD